MNLQIKRGGGVEARAFTEKNKIKKPTKYAVFCCRCKTVAFKFVRDQTENLKLGHLATVLFFFVVQTYGEGKKHVTVNLGFHGTPTQCSYCTLALCESCCSLGP